MTSQTTIVNYSTPEMSSNAKLLSEDFCLLNHKYLYVVVPTTKLSPTIRLKGFRMRWIRQMSVTIYYVPLSEYLPGLLGMDDETLKISVPYCVTFV